MKKTKLSKSKLRRNFRKKTKGEQDIAWQRVAAKLRKIKGPTPEIMTLRGLRMVTEADQGGKISLSQIKWLTGRDVLVDRNSHDKDTSPNAPTHTLFLLANHKPHAPADDLPIWDQVLIKSKD